MGAPAAFTADAQARREVELTAMRCVMEIEASLGHQAKDVSQLKCGYDIESLLPAELRDGEGNPLRFIEVKGRVRGARTVTVSKNEILTAFNKPEEYILAIVEVDGDGCRASYLRKPFSERPDFAATSVNYDIEELLDQAEVILKRGY